MIHQLLKGLSANLIAENPSSQDVDDTKLDQNMLHEMGRISVQLHLIWLGRVVIDKNFSKPASANTLIERDFVSQDNEDNTEPGLSVAEKIVKGRAITHATSYAIPRYSEMMLLIRNTGSFATPSHPAEGDDTAVSPSN